MSDIRKWKKKVWAEVSRYVRLRYADHRGIVECYTCGVKKHWKNGMQAGHAFSGRGNAILFELDVIRCQCYVCNCCNSGKLDVFTYKLRKELGNNRFEALYRLKGTQRKFTVDELKELRDKFKMKADVLLGPKGAENPIAQVIQPAE